MVIRFLSPSIDITVPVALLKSPVSVVSTIGCADALPKINLWWKSGIPFDLSKWFPGWVTLSCPIVPIDLPYVRSFAPTPVVKLFCKTTQLAVEEPPVTVLPTLNVVVSVVVCILPMTSFFAPLSWSTRIPVVEPDVIVSPITNSGVISSLTKGMKDAVE